MSWLPIHSTQPSPRESVATARQLKGLVNMEKDIQSNEGFADIEFPKEEEIILKMKEIQSEFLFKVERYCIVIFELFPMIKSILGDVDQLLFDNLLEVKQHFKSMSLI